MALGGGTWITQNKVLPGAYINFVSAASASAALSDRGIATMPLELDWGPEGKIFTVTNEEFQKDTLKIFGYAYTDDKMKCLRDLFINTNTLHAYRLNSGGTKAANAYAAALYSGICGNDIKIGIQANVDDATAYDVVTYFGTAKVDEQTVHAVEELEANAYVSFKPDFTLAAVSALPLSGGTNGTVDGAAWQDYADKAESYTFNTMGIATADDTVKRLFIAFNKRMRDEVGAKFQLVVYDSPKADYMGVISVKNKCTDGMYRNEEGEAVYPDEAAAVYWTTGAECGCAVNASCQNKIYDGEYTFDTDYTQSELTAAIKAGEYVFHKVNGEVRVLEDINTKVTVTDTSGDVFKDNQTIRVIDQLGNDDAVIFNTKYLGRIPNDAAGRTALWSDLVKIRKELQRIRAIEDFEDTDVVVSQGDSKKSVIVENTVTVVNAMSKLYMTTTIA